MASACLVRPPWHRAFWIVVWPRSWGAFAASLPLHEMGHMLTAIMLRVPCGSSGCVCAVLTAAEHTIDRIEKLLT
jgi:hypothetical protein